MSSNETKYINKSENKEEQQTKRDSSSLKRGVAVAGAMMAGSVAGAAGMEAYHRTHEDEITDNTEEITLEVTPTEDAQQQQNSGTPQTPVQPAQQGQEVQEVEIHVEEPNIDEPVLPASDTHETEEGEIIAEELVDPNDNDIPDFVEDVIGVEQVYTLDGSIETHAHIHNSSYGDMTLIDVDNDGDFDVILDANGNDMIVRIDEFENPVMSSEYMGEGGAGDHLLTLSDVELANDTIDPLNNMDIANNTIGDGIQQDIIDTMA